MPVEETTGPSGYSRHPLLRKLRGATVRARAGIGFDPNRTVLVTGAGRAGTTWIGELTAAISGGTLLFEPDHPRRGRLFRQVVDERGSTASRLALYRMLVRGRGANNWAVRDVRSFVAGRRLVLKSISATDIVIDLCRAGIVARPVVVVRHPCAVVASRLMAGFTPPDVGLLLAPQVLDRHPHLATLRDLDTPCQRYALAWAMTYLAVAAEPDEDIFVARYEDFVAEPATEIERLARHLGSTASSFDSIVAQRPSIMDFAGDLRQGPSQLTKWQERLDARSIAEILDVTTRAGFGIYGEGAMPESRPMTLEL